LVVNLDEFSELCGVTAETMRGHIRAVEGNPAWLIERGERGRGYKIEPIAARDWWLAHRAAADQANADRQAALQQLRFDLVGDAAGGSDALTLSGKQRREEIEAELVRIKLRRTMGELVEVAELEGPAANAAVELRRQLMLVPAQFAVEAGLSPEDVRPLGVMIERAINTFLDKLPSPLRGVPLRPTQGDRNA
jgi:hypothetical protein